MGEWEEKELGSILEALIDYRGKTPKKSEAGIPLVTAKVIKNGWILPPNEFLTTDEYDRWMTRGFPKKGDMVLTMEAPLGEVAIIEELPIALAQRTVAMRANDGHSTRFLKYFLQSRFGQHELKIRASGTTVQGIKSSLLKKVPIPSPPKNEQEAIAEVLSSLDDKIDLLKRQNKTLEGMAEALFRQWFIEKAQDDWEEVELKDIAENARNTMKPENINQNVKLVGLEHFDSKSLVLSRYENTEELGSQKYKFAQGQILFGKLRPYFHNIALPFFDGVCSTDILVIEAKRSTWRLFVFFFLNQDWVVEAATQSASGTRMPRTNWKFLGSLPIHFPDAKLLSEFNSIVEPIVTKMSKNWSEITLLQNQRDTLLPKLMSGEVRVQNIRIDE